MGDSGKTAWVTGVQRKGLIACALASSIVAPCGYGSVAQAQPVPDNTLGTTVAPDPLINNRFLINDGTPGGSNLFHSFINFSIDPGQQVYFANPLGFANILSRVTGTEFSDINGVLGVLDEVNNANLFLLNPRGVVFGPQAELDLNGSLTVSTAESIGFEGNQAFGISTPANELLTFSTPLGVQFNDQPLGNITIQGALAVEAGQSIELLGGDVLLEDTLLNVDGASLIAPGGTIRLLGNQIGLDSQATVNVNGRTDDSTVTIAADEIDLAPGSSISGTGELVLQPLALDQNIVLSGLADTDNTNLDLTTTDLDALNDGFSNITIGQANSNGSLTLAGNTIFSDPTTILTSTILNPNGFAFAGVDNANLTFAGDLTSPDGLNIFTNNDVVLENYTGGDFKIATRGSITANSIDTSNPDDNGGFIMLTAGGNITILERTNTSAGGDNNDAGTLTIDAGEMVTLGNDNVPFSHLGRPTGIGSGSDVDIEGASVNINGTIDPANLSGEGGTTGNTRITSTAGDIILSNGIIYGDIGNPNDPDANDFIGEGGDITLASANDIVLSNYALESTHRGTAGIGGNTSLTAAQSIRIENDSRITTDATNGGFAGFIDIDSGSGGTILDSVNISGKSEGESFAGSIRIRSTGSIEVTGENNFISTDITGEGERGFAGLIIIDSGDDGTVLNNVNISSQSDGGAPAGSIFITSTGDINVMGDSSIQTNATGGGPAGLISINSGEDTILNGTRLSSSSDGGLFGDSAGNITINSNGNNILNNSFVETNATGSGNAGAIDIDGNSAVQLTSSTVSSTASGDGNAGSIDVNSEGDIQVNSSTIFSDSFGLGDAGEISIDGNSVVQLNNFSTISSSASGDGNAGSIDVNSEGDIQVNSSTIFSDSFGLRNAGAIDIDGNSAVQLTFSTVSSTASGDGNAGSIDVNSEGDIQVDSSTIFSDSFGLGDAGKIAIDGNTAIQLNNFSTISSSSSDGGNGGEIALNSNGGINLDSSTISATTKGGDSGGTIDLVSAFLSLQNESGLDASFGGSGEGSDITITTTGTGQGIPSSEAMESFDVFLDNSIISALVEPEATVPGGAITINTDSLALTNGARIQAQTRGDTDAGDVVLNIDRLIDIQGTNEESRLNSGIDVSPLQSANGDGGNILINRPESPRGTLNISDNGFLAALTQSDADAGNIEINVENLNLETGGQIIAVSTSTGEAGSIEINALGEVFISGQGSGNESFQSPFSDEANLTALEFGTTADINFETLEGASFASEDAPENGGFAYFSFQVTEPNSQGIFDIDNGIDNGNTSNIDTELFLFEQSTGELLASNDDSFEPLLDAGSDSSLDSFINFTFSESGEYVVGVGEFDSFVLEGELISGEAPTSTQTYDLNISLQNAADGLTDVSGANPNPNQAVTDQAQVSNTNPGSTDQTQVFNSGLFASTSGEGAGGDITINIGESGEATTSAGGGASFIENTVNGADQPTLVLDDGGTISASTSGGGPGGNVTINSPNNPLRIQGDGQLTVSSTEANSGPSGDININVGALALLDGIQIEATNASLEEEGGDITIDAPDGFVMLDFSNLSTDRGSVIIAESTNPNGGRGGDITITTNEFFFTIPEQNNDIIANAVGGTGGDITITADRIFGFLLRTALDTQALRTNNTSDISARSEIGIPGVVDLINLSFDPAQGLNELALNLSNATDQIAEGCRANVSDTEQSEFVATGRGGLPSSPSDPLAAELESVPWVTAPDTDTTTATVSVTPHQPNPTDPLLEAQGWVETNGKTFFVADPSSNPSPQVSSIPTASLCSATVDK